MSIYKRTKRAIRHLSIHLEMPLSYQFAQVRNASERTTRGLATEAIREYLARHYPDVVSQPVPSQCGEECVQPETLA